MKGIAHFLTGVAVATCVPGVVAQAAQGSLLPALAGACGLLPDTLDFKLARFLERADYVLTPDAEEGAEALAARLAAAAAEAACGQPRVVRLHTVRAGADRWRRYAVRFDVPGQALEVRLGPLVTGGQVVLPDSEPPAPRAFARAPLPAPLEYTYDAEVVVDVFAGPSLRFAPALQARGAVAERLQRVTGPHPVRITFLPWHRAQSHSLILALLVGLLAGAACGPAAGVACGLAFAAHVLEDQLGAMGSNLFWPLTRTRVNGLGLLRSGDALPNFLTVWAAVAVTLFNLDRGAAQPQLSAPLFLAGALALPAAALIAAYIWQRRGAKVPWGVEREREAVAETEADGVA